MPESSQSVQVLSNPKYYIPPPAAIPSIWTAARNILFPMEVNGSISTFSGFHEDFSFID
jgi:hypothetical protein